LFEGIARGRAASFQLPKRQFPIEPVAAALCLPGIDANTTDLPNKTQSRRTIMRIQPFLALAALLAATLAPQARAEQPKQIVFVCLHGSVKSQMAAAYFNDIAKKRGLPFVAISRGIETDASIPPRIRDGLAADGLKPLDDVPQGLTAQEADSSVKVLAFDTVPADRKGSAEVTYWSDVPLDRKDYAATRDAIIRHIDQLVPSLTAN
jgi:protein-tyrosine-phosphatase